MVVDKLPTARRKEHLQYNKIGLAFTDEHINGLIQSCKKNDRKSQNALYNHYAPTVMNVAQRYANDDYEAKDIFLRTFEKAFHKIDMYDSSKGKFKNWLCRIASNEAISLKRSQKKYHYTDDLSIMDSDITLDVAERMDSEHIYELIKDLKEPYCTVFNMVLDGYKHAEIGAKLNFGESTSRSYYFRARSILKKKLLQFQKVDQKWEKIV